MMRYKPTSTIDEYISRFPKDTQHMLQTLRQTVRKIAPKTTETISYGIPTFKLNGKNLVHFGGYPHHIGFYPGAAGIAEFKSALAQYATSKGTVRFPIDKPIPYPLVEKIVNFRVGQEMQKAKDLQK